MRVITLSACCIRILCKVQQGLSMQSRGVPCVVAVQLNRDTQPLQILAISRPHTVLDVNNLSSS